MSLRTCPACWPRHRDSPYRREDSTCHCRAKTGPWGCSRCDCWGHRIASRAIRGNYRRLSPPNWPFPFSESDSMNRPGAFRLRWKRSGHEVTRSAASCTTFEPCWRSFPGPAAACWTRRLASTSRPGWSWSRPSTRKAPGCPSWWRTCCICPAGVRGHEGPQGVVTARRRHWLSHRKGPSILTRCRPASQYPERPSPGVFSAGEQWFP